MKKIPLIDCQNLAFSPRLAENRMDQAQRVFGPGVLKRFLCYSLYLFGVNRKSIGQVLGIPPETAKSTIKTINRHGLTALEERRKQSSLLKPKVPPEGQPVTLRKEGTKIIVKLGISDRVLQLNREDPLQVKTILLTMLNNGLLKNRQVGEVLQITPTYTAILARRLNDGGAVSLLDQRKGQKQDFRVPRKVKAEVVQQFALDVITSGKTSGRAISAELKERCDIFIPARTVRHHLAKMGLGKIKKSLPQLVAGIKKIP
jgi:Mn-dependent DtxR family transcriptional regulator